MILLILSLFLIILLFTIFQPKEIHQQTLVQNPEIKINPQFYAATSNSYHPMNYILLAKQIYSGTPYYLTVYMQTDRAPQSLISDTVRNAGIFAPVESTLFWYFLKDGCDVVVDVGANIGYFANMAASFGCQVVAVEPAEEHTSLIELSAEINSFDINVIRGVVGKKDGEIGYSFDWEHSGLSSVNGRSSVIVKQYELNGIVGDVSTSLFKIDIEGFETSCFDSIVTGGIDKYPNIIMEMKRDPEYETRVAFINTMLESGYNIYSYPEQYGTVPSTSTASFEALKDLNLEIFQILQPLKTDQWIPHEDLLFTSEPLSQSFVNSVNLKTI